MTSPNPYDQATGRAGEAKPPLTAGFETIERLLQEYRETGRSHTLAGWVSGVKRRVAECRAANPDPRSLKDLALVERAFDLAAEAVEYGIQFRPTAGSSGADGTAG